MRLSLHQLRVFSQVKVTQSITLAAKQLHMTQPAVSNIVKQLEDYYQCSLTTVYNRKTQLTDAGVILADAAHEINTILMKTENKIKQPSKTLKGKLSVAAVSTAKYFVPRLLAAFQKQHGDVHIKIIVCNRKEILERVKQNLDDFVIMSQPPKSKTVIVEHFYKDQLVVAGSSKSVLNTKKPYSLDTLKDENWLIRESGSGTRIAMMKLFKEFSIEPKIISEVGNNESIKQLIIADMGISIISLHSIELELNSQLISILPVKGFPKDHEWYKVTHCKKNSSEISKKFDEFVASHSDLTHFSSWKKNQYNHNE